MATVAPVPYSPSTMHIPQENRSCGGCHNSVEVDSGGVLVAFGNSLWHVDCFKCAKCGDRVSADTNLLLLSDGSPVCASCTYNCAVCKKPISDEAIMTGDESYHAACFSCKTCGRHIGELVFAKTTQGIYCMACHNDRVARSRRHAEQRRNRSKSRRDPHRDKERLQEKSSNTQLKDTSSTTIDPQSPNTPGFQNTEITSADAAVSYAAKRVSTHSIAATLHPAKPLQREPLPPPPASPTLARPQPSPTMTRVDVPQAAPSAVFSHSSVTPATRGDTLPLPDESESLGPRRKSFDDGVRPLNLLSPETVSSLSRTPSSSVGRTSRADKRSSINPAVRLDWMGSAISSDGHKYNSPISLSPSGESSSRQQSRHTSNESDELSTSPTSQDQQRPGTRASIDSFYSPPASPSLPYATHSQPSTETFNTQSKDSATTRKYTLQDQPHPSLPHKPSSQQSVSGRASPALPHLNGTHDGITGTPVHSRVATPDRELPKLPPGAEEAIAGRDYPMEKHPEESQVAPIALPPISLTETDTSLKELLSLGTRQSMQATRPMDIPEKPKEEKPHTPSREGGFEAGPSKRTSPLANTSSPTQVKSPSLPTTKPSSPRPPLDNLPKRSASLAMKMSTRKPVPKAIVLPDGFEGDMTLDREGSSNGYTSPISNSRPDVPRKTSDPVANPVRRPVSAGTGMPPPLSPRSKARRSSDNTHPGSPLATMTSPARSDSTPVVTVTDTAADRGARPAIGRQDTADLVIKRIKEALNDAQESGALTVRLDREFLDVIYLAVNASQEKLQEMRGKFDRMRRTSQQFIDGLSGAQDEYDKELAARRDAEAEVARLRVQLSGQAARLTQLSAEDRKREIGEQMSRDMSANLDDLERDLSRIMAERDLAVAEVEELTASKLTTTHGDIGMQRSLTHRFDSLKNQYKRELEPLLRQREALLREINELKEERNICLEEATALNARNEELAELNAHTTRQVEAGAGANAMRTWSSVPVTMGVNQQQQQQLPSTPNKLTPLPPLPQYYSSTTTLSLSQDERDEPRSTPNGGKLKWFKPSKDQMRPPHDAHGFSQEKEAQRHNFQQLTVLRVARCDHCGDKMWGTQLRCNICNLGCHNRCVGQVNVVCSVDSRPRDDMPLPPSMFGRDLIEQVRADSVREHRDIPIIVEKCIEAVELLAMDYEGIYRKTGGTAQSKAITQLFERGNYDAFNLNNPDTFNDVSSVTSVLKTYFRQLPNPLLTNALHEAFVSAAGIRDLRSKADSLTTLVYQLPSEHFHTLRYLMLHLHRVQSHSTENLMNARNLGVIFGPTLMRSSDPNREFADMAGKALAIEWLIENAASVFREDT